MPLKTGSSRKTISRNIRTTMHEYEKSGKIGRSAPQSKKKAQKQAIAIAMDKARKSGGGRATQRKGRGKKSHSKR